MTHRFRLDYGVSEVDADSGNDLLQLALAGGLGLAVCPGTEQRRLEVEVIPVAPVHEVAKQIAERVLIVGAGRALEVPQGGARRAPTSLARGTERR